MHVVLVGMNHRTADVCLREKCALDRAGTCEALERLRREHGLAEAVIVSTCNRVEITAAGPEPEALAELLEGFLAGLGGMKAEELKGRLYRRFDDDAARHLMCVASGLDSMVPGEGQVLGQVREAYLWARECEATGRLLNGLFQRTFAAAKRIRSQTELGRGQLSVSSVAVDLAGRVFEDFKDKTVLVVGAGETGKLTLVNLAELGVGRILLANRTAERARELSERFGGQAVPFDEMKKHLAEADIVICSTSASEVVLTKRDVEASLAGRRGRPLLVVDVAVPRDVEASVGDLPGVFLYDIDDLKGVVENNLKYRQEASEKALELVDEEVERFREWMIGLDLGELVQQLRETLHREGDAELERLSRRLEHLSEEDREVVARSIRRLLNRILHVPMETLHREAHRGGSEFAGTVRKLFDIEEEEKEGEKDEE